MAKEEILKIFKEEGFRNSRLISMSKSGYRRMYPKDRIMFNANIVVKRRKKVWQGDLNITKDAPALQKVADRLGMTLLILPEMLARFGSEKLSYKFHKNHADAMFVPDSDDYFVRAYDNDFAIVNLGGGMNYMAAKPGEMIRRKAGKS